MIRGPITLLIVGSILLGGIALVAYRPRILAGVLPDPIIRALEDTHIITAGSDDLPAGDTPAEFLVDDAGGIAARGPIAAMAGNLPVFIDDVITGYTTAVAADIPAEVTTIRPITGCRLTRPEAGTLVGHVTAGQSNLPLALATYNDTHLAAAVQVLVDGYRSGATNMASDLRGPPYEAYDVAVTETGAPVYLVLETGAGNRIWNIHLAPGARIERVVLLGGDQAGVANLDPVVPVEVLLGDALATCGIRPAYPLNEGHQLFRSLKVGTLSQTEAESRLATLKDAVAAYDIWFRDTFGVLATDTRAGYAEGTLSMVGPVPGDAGPKAVYAAINGSRVRTTQDAFFDIRRQGVEF